MPHAAVDHTFDCSQDCSSEANDAKDDLQIRCAFVWSQVTVSKSHPHLQRSDPNSWSADWLPKRISLPWANTNVRELLTSALTCASCTCSKSFWHFWAFSACDSTWWTWESEQNHSSQLHTSFTIEVSRFTSLNVSYLEINFLIEARTTLLRKLWCDTLFKLDWHKPKID